MGLITYGASLRNEVKGWPCLVRIGSGFDMVTQNQWWDDEGTPTTKATAVPSSGEAGLDAKFLEVIKCITDAADEGFNQRYTYADEPRLKSGAHISALIWVATTTGGSGITAKLRNSDASSTTATAVTTDGDWTLLCIEDHTCAGTYVELVVTKDASGTFYAGGPITVMVGADAIALPPRGLRYRAIDDPTSIKTLTGIGDEATWTDIDCTAATSNLAAKLHGQYNIFQGASSTDFELHVRRNGSSEASGVTNQLAAVSDTNSEHAGGDFIQLLDDAQIFEYFLDRTAGAVTLQFGVMGARGYWEWE